MRFTVHRLLPVLFPSLLGVSGCSKSGEDTRSEEEKAAGIRPIAMTASEVPEDIVLVGRFVEGVSWKDVTGEHMLILSETGPVQGSEMDDSGGETQDAALQAVHALRAGDRYVSYWTVADAVRGCPFDVFAQFRKGSLRVTDLNNDGTAETWFMYLTACTGDVSPSNLRLLMHEGKSVYEMKGLTRVDLGHGNMEGGRYTFDEALMNGPREFLDYALKLWQEHVLETWGE